MNRLQSRYQRARRDIRTIITAIERGDATEKDYWRAFEFQRQIERELFVWAKDAIGVYGLFENCPHSQRSIVLMLISEWGNQ